MAVPRAVRAVASTATSNVIAMTDRYTDQCKDFSLRLRVLNIEYIGSAMH